MKRATALLACLSLAAAAPAAEPPRDIYLLMGQSNMSGRGLLAELSAADRATDPRIQLYGNNGRWRVAAEPLDDAAGQVDPVSADLQAAVGPGLAFARAILARNDRPIGLVPCAKGGSSLAEWRPSPARSTLYGSCIARAREAGGRLAGIFWYQGESDTKTAATAAAWRPAFEAMVRRFRADLGSPRLPLVLVQLADRPEEGAATYPYWMKVQQAQAEVRLPCAAMVVAMGLPRNPDRLHLATSGQLELGGRAAVAMRGLCRDRIR